MEGLGVSYQNLFRKNNRRIGEIEIKEKKIGKKFALDSMLEKKNEKLTRIRNRHIPTQPIKKN